MSSKTIKTLASRRVSELEAWHKETMENFTKSLSDEERAILAHGFLNGLSLNAGAVPSAGAVVSLDINDAIFVIELLNILHRAPKTPSPRFMYRFIHLSNGSQILAKDPIENRCTIPLVKGSKIPHMFPFSTTLREGYSMHALEMVYRKKGLLTDKKGVSCCLLRIRVPANYPAYFIGPTPMATQKSIQRISETLMTKEKHEFEVLLHPSMLEVTKVSSRNLCSTMSMIPEYSKNVPAFDNLTNYWCDIPIYECEMRPLDLEFVVCTSAETASKVLGVSVASEVFLASPSNTRDDVVTRLKAAVLEGKARRWPLESLSDSDVVCAYRDIGIDVDAMRIDLEKMANVMEILNTLLSSIGGVPKSWIYPTERIRNAIVLKDVPFLRKQVGTFADDISRSFMGLGHLFTKRSEVPMSDVIADLESAFEIDDAEILEVTSTSLKEYIQSNRLFLKYAEADVREYIEEIAEHYDYVEKRLKKATRNFDIQRLESLRVAGRTAKLEKYFDGCRKRRQ